MVLEVTEVGVSFFPFFLFFWLKYARENLFNEGIVKMLRQRYYVRLIMICSRIYLLCALNELPSKRRRRGEKKIAPRAIKCISNCYCSVGVIVHRHQNDCIGYKTGFLFIYISIFTSFFLPPSPSVCYFNISLSLLAIFCLT